MIAIIDYEMGNLRSVQKAIERAGGTAVITYKNQDILDADKIVLPGVGAMSPAIDRLTHLEMIPVIKKVIAQGKPFLGICLGFQLLFESSDEGGIVKGLGIIPGVVKRFASLKVPHMGWNQIRLAKRSCPLWQGIADDAHVYFCHSYYGHPVDAAWVAATTDYGLPFAAAIARDNIFGVQFHPEKSQEAGIQILRNFVRISA
jgi:glutamine amidotransferase